MGKATNELIHEHEAIKKVLNLLELSCKKIRSNDELDTKLLFNLIEFLKDFADKCHHGKEEQYLFEALAQSGMSKSQGPVAVMLHEHEQGRYFIKMMSDSLSDFVNSKLLFIESAEKYIFLLRNHIEKENNILFRMADQILNDDIQDDLFSKFENYENEVMGKKRHEELHQIIDSVSMKLKYS